MPYLSADALAGVLREVYVAVGVPPDAAEVVANAQVEADLAGHASHGVMKTADYVALIERGHLVPDAEIELVDDRPNSAVIDAHWALGFVATQQAVDLAGDKAERHGVAAVTVRQQGHIGRLGAYSSRAAQRGLIGLVTADSGRAPKSVAPYGGRGRRLGTNPLSIAVPSGSHGPIVLDMATATAAKGKLTVARDRGDTVPEGWLVDADGRPTTDPGAYDEGGALLPLGADQAYKGFGLSFMIEVLSGLLTGIGFGTDPDGIHNDGVFIAAFAVDAFRDQGAFERDVDDFVAYLKQTPLAQGHDEILYPGELEHRRAEHYHRDGIPVGSHTLAHLTRVAERLGVETRGLTVAT
ncbi:Ldh family oxidoreductase [Egibacter rhizosphaerae]|uniref:Ldh family oxidoreductase n=1 Tax=Egibacter rhizosphaerae TaxID=1670831 RepID=A0A411YH02_9ACTN|nr:Ldh family oxidoreductase [Egibacter rhizosphaerae]QBI20510.1 Ldh family oxidoreductase [Egibacter rhizosphaerae]